MIAFLYVTIGFVLYHFISNSSTLKNYFIKKYGHKIYSAIHISFIRLIGFLFYGVIPLLIILIFKHKSLFEYGLNFRNTDYPIVWVILLCSIIILINYPNRVKPDNLKLYPQIRNKEWSYRLLIYSALGWILYLAAYEFLFRGFLLYHCVYAFGIGPAIAINVGIYSLVHIPKGKKEAIGAIPLGLILCILTLKTGNILSAFIIHVIMALSNEWFTLGAHPVIHLIKKNNST